MQTEYRNLQAVFELSEVALPTVERRSHLVLTGLSYGDLKFAIALPPGYEGRDDWPAILFLHGSGELGQDGERQSQVGIGRALNAHPERYPAVVIMPQMPSDFEGWNDDMLRPIVELVDHARRELRINPDHFACTGISMGGAGVWELARNYPGLFSHFLPICGYGDHRDLPETLSSRKIMIAHGQNDDVISANESRRFDRSLKEIGSTSVELRILPEEGHEVWDRIYSDERTSEWLLTP